MRNYVSQRWTSFKPMGGAKKYLKKFTQQTIATTLAINSSNLNNSNSTTGNINQIQRNILVYLKEHLFKASDFSRNSLSDSNQIDDKIETPNCNCNATNNGKFAIFVDNYGLIWKWSFFLLSSLIAFVSIVLILALTIKIVK